MGQDNSAPHRSRVDLDDQESVRYWEQYFGVTVEQLQDSVSAVGSDPQAVKEHLTQQGGSAGAS